MRTARARPSLKAEGSVRDAGYSFDQDGHLQAHTGREANFEAHKVSDGNSHPAASASDHPECSTIQEAAEFLGVHKNTIRNWIASGRIEAVQPAGTHGRILIPVAALRSLKTESAVTSVARCRSPEGNFLCPNCGSKFEKERTETASGSSMLNEALSEVYERFQRTKRRMKLLKRSVALNGEESFA